DTLRPGGAQRALVEIANQTLSAGADVSVCVTRGGCDMAAQLKTGVPACVLERTRRFDWAAIRRFARWVQQQKPDVIHSHGRTTLSFLVFVKTLGLIRQPLVMHDHTGKARRDTSAPLWFRALARRHIAHYVGVCAEMDGWAERSGIPSGRRSLIPGALDLRNCPNSVVRASGVRVTAPGLRAKFDMRREFRVSQDALLGVCLGGVRPEKGIDILLAAVAQSSRRGAFKIVVVGGVRDQKYWNDCQRETNRLGLENEVFFAGERTDVHTWLDRFDFAVHAARSESGPLAVIEHLAAGLPLVSTHIGGIAQRAAELGVERFVPPDDSAALAAAIDELLSSTPRQLSERARIGKQIALNHFDIRAVMPAWRRVYEKVAQREFPEPRAAETAA
ncbi:MAG: glycosyltransferase family 4 protein, partial [Bryobacterales bacterium]